MSPRPGAGVEIIAVNYACHELIEKNLVPLLAALPEAGCTIVDSFHSREARIRIEAVTRRFGWTLVSLVDNPGFGAAMNSGVRSAAAHGADTVLLVNPDLEIGAEAAMTLVQKARHDARSIVAPRIERPDGAMWSSGAVLDRRGGRPGRTPNPDDRIEWVSGACLAISTRFFDELAGFDEDYFMYWEDVDLSFRCCARGGRLSIVEAAVAVHEVGATQGVGKSPLYIRSCCRNRLLFAAKHLSRSEIGRWLVATPRSSWLIARRGTRRSVLVRSPRLVAAMLAGTTSGVRAAVASLISVRRSG